MASICQEEHLNLYDTPSHGWLSPSIWLMPVVIDAVLARYCFCQASVNRNRNVVYWGTSLQVVQAAEEFKNEWINKEVPPTKTIIHLVATIKEELRGISDIGKRQNHFGRFTHDIWAEHFDIQCNLYE
jgi:hypothetical protein